MFICDIFFVVSLMSFLRGFFVSSCVYNCADKPVFTPSSLVVKFGDPTSATCSVCQHACVGNHFDLEKSLGTKTTNGTRITWEVKNMTEWDASIDCYYNDADDTQCCTLLPVTVYQPPNNVSISFNHTDPMIEGRQYTLQCSVHEVAPVKNLNVTFYKGQTVLGHQQSNNTGIKPVTETLTLNVTASKEDDGVQYWCEAKLELGPEGPQRPPVVTSQKILATVLYLKRPSNPNPIHITISEGDRLQLDCSTKGNPRPSYSWTHPNSTRFNSSILIITSVEEKDRGEYTCFASNNVRNITVKYNVDVQVSNIGLIIAMILVVLVVLVVGILVYYNYYKHNRTGQYNLFKLRPKGGTVV